MGKNIAFVIRELRLKNGLAQYEFGKKVGVSFSAVSCWESGKRQPNKKEIQKICDVFDVDYNYLFGITSVEKHEIVSSDAITIPLFDRKCSSKRITEYAEFADNQKPKYRFVLPLECLPKKDGFFAVYATKDDHLTEAIQANDLLIFRILKDRKPRINDIVCCKDKDKLILCKKNNIKGTPLGTLTNILKSYSNI